MKVCIAAIGRLRQGPERDLIDTYAKRIPVLGSKVGVTGFSEIEKEPGAGKNPSDAEAKSLLSALTAKDKVFALDERGKALTSRGFASAIEQAAQDGAPRLALLIGGADGHGDAVRARADRVISLGAMTWPHMLARVMLCEQLYRAVSILANHPYHRD